MRSIALRSSAVLLSLPVLWALQLAAQNGRLYVPHTSATAPTTFTYRNSKGGEDNISDEAVIQVPEGAKLCVLVPGANPLLYTYAAKAEEITLKTPEGIGDFLEALKKLAGGLKPLAEESGEYAEYRRHVDSAQQALVAVEERKWASEAGGFPDNWAEARKKLDDADKELAEAKTLYDKNAKTEEFQTKEAALQHATRELLAARAATVREEWTGAEKQYNLLTQDGACVGGGTKNLKITFTVKEKGPLPKNQTRTKYTGDVIKNITVETSSRRVIAGSLGGMLGLFRGIDTFTVVSSNVQSGEESRTVFRPAAFLYGRPSSSWPVWLTVGVGTGDKIKYPDLFMGLSSRIGGDATTPLVTIGVGALWSAFPTKLTSGATVGAPLPASIKNLSDAVGYDRHWGVGLHVSVFGLDLIAGAKDTEKKGAGKPETAKPEEKGK